MSNSTVLQFAWKSSKVVLFMTAVHGTGRIVRTRKRSKNGDVLTRGTWGTEYEKDLFIPDFVDAYNHNMNGVDLADQGRAECCTKRRTYYTWKFVRLSAVSRGRAYDLVT